MVNKKIKLTSEITKGNKIQPTSEKIEIENFQHPVFCFKYLNKDFHLDSCTDDERISFVNQLVKLSNLSWQEIQFAPKNGLGTEKIKVKSIKSSVPKIITEDVEFLLAFRFHGKAPFVGLRNRFVFHVIFLDRNFTLYDH